MNKDELIGAGNKVIVSFTTIAQRIKYIAPMVKSILDQTILPDDFELYISNHPSLFKGGLDTGIKRRNIPRLLLELEEKGRLKINYVDNIGPANKLIPTLYKNKNNENIIITVDDDTIYPRWTIYTLLVGYYQSKSAVSLRAWQPTIINDAYCLSHNNWQDILTLGKYKHAFILGSTGALYKSSFFDDKIFDIDTMLKLSPKNDDVWFHFMRVAKKQSAYIIPVCYANNYFPFISLPNGSNCLRNTNQTDDDNWIKNVANAMGIKTLLSNPKRKKSKKSL